MSEEIKEKANVSLIEDLKQNIKNEYKNDVNKFIKDKIVQDKIKELTFKFGYNYAGQRLEYLFKDIEKNKQEIYNLLSYMKVIESKSVQLMSEQNYYIKFKKNEGYNKKFNIIWENLETTCFQIICFSFSNKDIFNCSIQEQTVIIEVDIPKHYEIVNTTENVMIYTNYNIYIITFNLECEDDIQVIANMELENIGELYENFEKFKGYFKKPEFISWLNRNQYIIELLYFKEIIKRFNLENEEELERALTIFYQLNNKEYKLPEGIQENIDEKLCEKEIDQLKENKSVHVQKDDYDINSNFTLLNSDYNKNDKIPEVKEKTPEVKEKTQSEKLNEEQKGNVKYEKNNKSKLINFILRLIRKLFFIKKNK